MSLFETVKVYLTPHNIRDGVDIGPGFAVIPDRMPEDANDIIQIGDDIRAVVMTDNRKAGNIVLNVELNHLIELHEILCEIPFEAATLHDSEPPTERHPAIESMISELEERMEFFERRE
jgi:hypothetical protein